MIRINLLGVERPKTRRLPTFTVQAQQLTIACSLILVGSVAGIGWWFWTLRQSAAQVEVDITSAQQEQARLQSVLAEVTRFEARRSQLQQRVQLIQQLRAGQSMPVQLLDHVSRSVPDMLWLTDMDQKGETLTIEGRSRTIIAISDFIANLRNSDLLVKPSINADTLVETLQATPAQPGVELVKFKITATLDKAAAAKAGAPAGTPAPGGGGGAAVR